MNTIDFCYWLQGYFELAEKEDLSPEQVKVIKNHLNLVFKHEIDPLRESQTSTPVDVLNITHSPTHSPTNDPLVKC